MKEHSKADFLRIALMILLIGSLGLNYIYMCDNEYMNDRFHEIKMGVFDSVFEHGIIPECAG